MSNTDPIKTPEVSFL